MDGLLTKPAEHGSLSVHSHVGSNAAAGSLSKLVACISKDAGFDGANSSAAACLEHLTQECKFSWSPCCQGRCDKMLTMLVSRVSHHAPWLDHC